MKEKILKLKKEKNAVILAHYYCPDEAQEIADYVGDSFYLAKVARECDSDVIVFCGVSFMGESAKILNPGKKVLMPDLSADCPMAHMVTREKIAQMRKAYTDLAVVCYINSTAELKCLSDICVTSSNALKIVNSLENENIFFIPDRNLGRYVKENSNKNVILNDGYCPVHENISAESVMKVKNQHPDIKVLAHPECNKGVLQLADVIGSTKDIIDYAKKSDDKEFIIITETGVDYALRAEGKRFYYPSPCPKCDDMSLNTLENIYAALKYEENEVIVADDVREKALIPLERMLELGK